MMDIFPRNYQPQFILKCTYIVFTFLLSVLTFTTFATPVHLFLDSNVVWDAGDIAAIAFLQGLADQCDVKIIGITAGRVGGLITEATSHRTVQVLFTYGSSASMVSRCRFPIDE